jgi:hypothetical protein
MKNADLRSCYFGRVQAEFHDCFKSRLQAVANGELSMRTTEDVSDQFWCGMISGKEVSLMKKLPDARLEGELARWRHIASACSLSIGHPYVRWLLCLVLSKDFGERLEWKFSFCEGKWIKFAGWVHCVKCRRCHKLQGAPEMCWQ